MKSVCVLGGYGIFGSRIVASLAREGIPVIIAGRHEDKAKQLSGEIKKNNPTADVKTAAMDVRKDLQSELKQLQPFLVINACGPFQGSDYRVAKACIELGIHYIDLADGRDYVANIDELDADAKASEILVITGASTVPGLSSAVIEKFKDEFKVINRLDYGITPGGKTPRGVATAKSILSYIGKPLKPFAGGKKVYGWQDQHRIKYPQLGYRWMGNCDVPDLDLLPKAYNIQEVHFSAGMESSVLQFGIWGLSWLVRLGLSFDLMKCAGALTKMSHIFDVFGSEDGGMHVILNGVDHNNKPLTIKWFVIVKDGDGPHVPTIPSILLAKKILAGELTQPGARACVGLISLDDYLQELSRYATSDYTLRQTI